MSNRNDEDSHVRLDVDSSPSNASISAHSIHRSASFCSARSDNCDPVAHSTAHSSVPQNATILTPAESLNTPNRWSRSTVSSSHTQDRSSLSNPHMPLLFTTSFLELSPSSQQAANSLLSEQPKEYPEHKSLSSITLPPINTLPKLQLTLNCASPLMVPVITSPASDERLPATVRSTDYFGRNWNQFSHMPNNFPRKGSSSEPTSIGLDSYSVPRSTHTRAEPPQEMKPRPRASSKHRSSLKSREGPQSTNKNLRLPSQKTMLSKALQKANTAVLLDNAQNFEGAMQAYLEACALLYQVMLRSSGDEDCRKLEAIHNTYTSRISELENIAPQLVDDSKALPARPDQDAQETLEQEIIVKEEKRDTEAAHLPATTKNQKYVGNRSQTQSVVTSQLPPRRESLLQLAPDSSLYARDSYSGRAYPKSSSDLPSLEGPMDSLYMPPPLSPKRPPSPLNQSNSNPKTRQKRTSDLVTENTNGHARLSSDDSMSWLGTIEESAGSKRLSRKSSGRVSRKSMRASSSRSESQFDAALDAAVEAAYGDQFLLINPLEPASYERDEYLGVANVRQKAEIAARKKMHQAERVAPVLSVPERERIWQKKQPLKNDFDDEYDSYKAEEERILEEITRDLGMDELDSGLVHKSSLPPKSQSSEFLLRTWNGPKSSNAPMVGAVAPNTSQSSTISQVSTLQSRIFTATPPSPPTYGSPPSSSSVPTPPNGNNRRFSRQNTNKLKIETATTPSTENLEPFVQPIHNVNSKSAVSAQLKNPTFTQSRQKISSTSDRSPSLQFPIQASSMFPQGNPSNILPNITATSSQNLIHGGEAQLSGAGSPVRALSRNEGSPVRALSRNGLRTKLSSSSLKNMKGRNVSAPTTEDSSETSPITPVHLQFNGRADGNKGNPAIPYLPLSIPITLDEKPNGSQVGNMSLFNSDINLPESPRLPPAADAGAPIPLEPCPTEYLLRPFWLMRALYQTITHPKGGYISNKLFIPCEIWQVKGAKIKNVEEKIANCDLLTAALNKLSRVDALDADAVLDEMLALETVIEQAQAVLAKKLGNEVGIHNFGGSGYFKDVSVEGDAENISGLSKSGTTSSKSSSFSWRRLRSKNSGVGLSATYSSKAPTDSSKESLTISTLPMTSTPLAKTRFVRRDLSQISFSGPNAGYMSALTRLFDSAQALDLIARQVEDPGLRHADKTQVGLELCIRHASEFFGFYVCRFVLADVTMLLDKFIKRGGEWVLV